MPETTQTRRVPFLNQAGKLPLAYLPGEAAEIISARDTAVSSASTASTAAADSATVKAELEAIFLGGTQAVNDAAVATFAGTSGTATSRAIDTAVATFTSTEGTATRNALDATNHRGAFFSPVRTASDVIASYIDFAAPRDLTIAVAGDSLFNDRHDTPGRCMLAITQQLPEGVGGREFTTDAADVPAYGSAFSWKAGAETPASGGAVMTDTFNRTSVDLVGSTSSGGQTWGGAAAKWSSNGSVASSVGTLGDSLDFDAGSKTVTVTETLRIITAASTPQRSWRIYAAGAAASGTVANSGTHIFADMNVTTSGAINFSLYKRITGSATLIGATAFNPPGTTVNSNTPVDAVVELKVDGLNISLTLRIAGQADMVIASGTLTTGDLASLGTRVGTSAQDAGSNIVMDAITVVTPVIAATFRGISLYNGAVAGSQLSWHTSRVATLYPASRPVDVLLVTNGHNGALLGVTDSAFIQMWNDFEAAFKAVHPDAKWVVFSQNAQKPGTMTTSTTTASHVRKQHLLREWALEHGHEYAPAFESFANQADGGVSLVNADGVHPTMVSDPFSFEWSGQWLMASSWLQQVRARRRIGTAAPITTQPTLA